MRLLIPRSTNETAEPSPGHPGDTTAVDDRTRDRAVSPFWPIPRRAEGRIDGGPGIAERAYLSVGFASAPLPAAQ